MTSKEVRQCFASLLVLDGKEEREKPGGETERLPEHLDTPEGIFKKQIFFNVTLIIDRK